MKVARFVQEGGQPRFGILDGDEIVPLAGDPMFAGYETLNERIPLVDVDYLAPVIPRSKAVGFVPAVADPDAVDPDAVGPDAVWPGVVGPGVGRRGAAGPAAEGPGAAGRPGSDPVTSHPAAVGPAAAAAAAPGSADEPAEPILYLEPNTAVVGPGDSIRVPDGIGTVQAFGALAIVIGALARDVRPDDAAQVVFGYTVANDVTATDLAAADGQWARAKSYDSFLPLGPVIETELDADAVEIIIDIDGDERRRGTLAADVRTAVAQASAVMTLLPGDVILIPLLAGVELDEGVTVEVTIPAIGTLRSDVRAR
ncbi:MAG: fumarylacetoacetate hydrolase family protein [Microbacteriaceae bacterium]